METPLPLMMLLFHSFFPSFFLCLLSYVAPALGAPSSPLMTHTHIHTHAHTLTCIRAIKSLSPQAPILLLHTAREASWRRAFDPCAPLLFILYHYLEQNLHFGSVPEPPQVLSARSFLVSRFDTLNIPRSFSCGERDMTHDSFISRVREFSKN